MEPIPPPQLLDPDRIGQSHRIDSTTGVEELCELLNDELHHSCAYAQQLWHDLDAMRTYLLHSLGAEPGSPSFRDGTSASPTGPDDDIGWDNWIAAYAAVTSTLCGPHGDSGFGLSEGRREAALRRAPSVARTDTELPMATQQRDQTPVETTARSSPEALAVRVGRLGAVAVLVVLAVRGLRPRRRPNHRPNQ